MLKGIPVSFGYSLSAELEGSRYYYFGSRLGAITLLIFGAMFESVSIVGNGKVARYVHRSLQDLMVNAEIFARNPREAHERPLEALGTESDLCLICVSDDHIAQVSQSIPQQSGLVVHSSGTVSMEALDTKHAYRGIFYPLMSISEEATVDFKQIPFCLEATDDGKLTALQDWCQHLGLQHFHVPSSIRRQLHLAAVVSHNFSNYLYHWAYQSLKEVDLPMAILKPLLQQQLHQLDEQDPISRQTGPAIRGDEATLETHQRMLKDGELKELYRQISLLIQREYEEKL